MIDHHLPPDPDLSRLITESGDAMRALAQAVKSAPDGAVHLTTTLQQPGSDPATVESLRSAIDALFDQADWHHALPLATRLFTLACGDPSASYRLGTCLQRMGKPAEALAVFSHCALTEGDNPSPGPLLRLGECLAAVGKTEQALEMLDACVEAARSDPSHSDLQEMATRKAMALRGS